MSNVASVVKTVAGIGTASAPVVAKLAPSVASIPEPLMVAGCLFMASLGGAYASFSWGDPVEPRSKMARLFVSCVVMGLAFTMVFNWAVQHWSPFALTLGAKAGMSAIISCLTRFWMPILIDSIRDGTWKELIPFIRKKG